MIADVEQHQCPPFDTLPITAQCRLITAFTLLADSCCYVRSFGEPAGQARFVLCIADLLQAGVIRPDCQWLLAAGHMEPFATPYRKKHRQRADQDLDEQMLVVLTASGEAAAAKLLPTASIDGTLRKHRFGPRPGRTIHYDTHSRELFVDDRPLLKLPSIARNMHRILTRFEAHQWREQILAAPLDDLPPRKRAQAVRGAVHRLNELQDVPQIEFGSFDMGAFVYYRIVDQEAKER